jgi:hypothetical protein
LDRTGQITSTRALGEIATLRRKLVPSLAVPAARDYVEQFDARFGAVAGEG